MNKSVLPAGSIVKRGSRQREATSNSGATVSGVDTKDGALLPGAELVDKGLADLAVGAETIESLLVSVGASRLRDLGYDVPAPFENAEERLYLLLGRDDPAGAHGRYNALVRRLVSFERAAESAR